jgi:hypothetical protein
MGLVMAPVPATALSGIEPRHAASAAGVISTSLQAGGAIGVAVVGVVCPVSDPREGRFRP